ncbi:MAG: serine/threonine protein kinase [Lentisphaeria bacterium]|jgi:serine/threonine protein kinase
MDKLHWLKIRKIFDHIVDKTPSHRKDYIMMVCEGNETLKADVESLLIANDHACENTVAWLPHDNEQHDISEFAGFKIIRELGRGGMGVVYHALDQNNNDVALKVLPAYLVQGNHARERFEQEARALRCVSHESICQIMDVFCDDSGQPCIMMELCTGEPLGAQHRNKPIDVDVALSIIKQVASALAVAHRQGIFHRDIKPENIIVNVDNRIKLIDFGIAKFADTRLTATGIVIGSPSYMSPEQWRCEKVDQRTDLWSLGVLLYEMLAGGKPFERPTKVELAKAVFEENPKDIPFDNNAGINKDVGLKMQKIVFKLMQKNPDYRYNSCEDLLKDLSTLGR